MKTIPLTNSDKVALVDDRDFKRVMELKWYFIAPNPSYPDDGYAKCTSPPYSYLHHFVKGNPPEGHQTDHKNRAKLDCRKKNLRFLTQLNNQHNTGKRKTNKSGFKGVCWNGKYWVAQIRINGRATNLGSCFSTAIEAAKVRDAAALKYQGEHAYTNFPMRFPRIVKRFPRLLRRAA